MIKDKIDKR